MRLFGKKLPIGSRLIHRTIILCLKAAEWFETSMYNENNIYSPVPKYQVLEKLVKASLPCKLDCT